VVRDASGRIEHAGWLDLCGERAGELRPIGFAGRIPGDNIASRPQLPASTGDGVVTALSALTRDAEGQALLRDVFNAEELVPLGPDDRAVYDEVRATLELARSA
jgi:ABC-type phosphate/phosphonate transport system substrate-binding protein